MHVLHVLSFVIERVGPGIRPYTAALVQYLPMLWQESTEHNMLRCAILTTLIHLVQVDATVFILYSIYILVCCFDVTWWHDHLRYYTSLVSNHWKFTYTWHAMVLFCSREQQLSGRKVSVYANIIISHFFFQLSQTNYFGEVSKTLMSCHLP